MADKHHIQIVAVMPGGGFESLGLVELDNLDEVMAPLATLCTRGGHQVSVIDIRRAYERATSAQASLEAHRRSYGTDGNNDAVDDGA